MTAPRNYRVYIELAVAVQSAWLGGCGEHNEGNVTTPPPPTNHAQSPAAAGNAATNVGGASNVGGATTVLPMSGGTPGMGDASDVSKVCTGNDADGPKQPWAPAENIRGLQGLCQEYTGCPADALSA